MNHAFAFSFFFILLYGGGACMGKCVCVSAPDLRYLSLSRNVTQQPLLISLLLHLYE